MPSSADDVFTRSLRPFLYEPGHGGPSSVCPSSDLDGEGLGGGGGLGTASAPVSFLRPAHTARGWRLCRANASDLDGTTVKPFVDGSWAAHEATLKDTPSVLRFRAPLQRYGLRLSGQHQALPAQAACPEVEDMAIRCAATAPERRIPKGETAGRKTRRSIAPIVPWRPLPSPPPSQASRPKALLPKANLSAPGLLELVASACGSNGSGNYPRGRGDQPTWSRGR